MASVQLVLAGPLTRSVLLVALVCEISTRFPLWLDNYIFHLGIINPQSSFDRYRLSLLRSNQENDCPPCRWLPTSDRTAPSPSLVLDCESTRVTTSNTVVFFQQQDVGYTGCRAPVSGDLPRSASIIFFCAFSDNVGEIVRTLHNGLVRTNRKVRGIRENPPLHILWPSLPESRGAVAGLLPVHCSAVAFLLLQLLLCRGRHAGLLELTARGIIMEVLTDAPVLL